MVVSTQAISKRGFFQKEIKLALDTFDEIPLDQIYLLPVRLDKCEVPPQIKSVQYIDLFPDWNAGFQKIIAAINFQKLTIPEDESLYSESNSRLFKVFPPSRRSVPVKLFLGIAVLLGWTLSPLFSFLEEGGWLGYLTGLFAIIISSWLVGSAHMGLTESDEHGLLTQKRFYSRVLIYSLFLFVTLPSHQLLSVNKNAIGIMSKELSLFLTISTVNFFVFIVGLSYLEAFWFKVMTGRERTGRISFFYKIGLPILYSSLYFFWILIILIWINLLSFFANLTL